jgi:hypothetical protein
MSSGSFNDTESVRTEAILQRFNHVFLSHDPTALRDLIADDCILENTQPAPDGARLEGKDACIALWTQIATTEGIHFEPESIIARGDRGEIRWRMVWGAGPRQLGAGRQPDARAGWTDRRGPRLHEGYVKATPHDHLAIC